jgi:hypothetical protein
LESCFDGLKTRGLKGVKLVTSDGHKGIQAAVEAAFLGACHENDKKYECFGFIPPINNPSFLPHNLP